MKKITVLGGGTGTFVVLSGLKKHPLDLGVIVSMMDSGGSTGRLRDQLEVLPPGDLRQCLVALSDAQELWRKLFLYRFERGDLSGHNFGNVFLSALEKVTHNYQEVIDTAGYVLKTRGQVIPVTFEKTHLCVQYENGKELKGEGYIDENNAETSRIKHAFLDPQVTPNPRVLKRIDSSDYIIIGPGDLYTSIIPILLVPEISQHLAKTKAKIIFIMNLMTKSGQTTGYSAQDHVLDLIRYMKRKPDIILYHSTAIPDHIVTWYREHNEKPIVNDLGETQKDTILQGFDLIDTHAIQKSDSDVLTRSILRHDSDKLAKALLPLIKL